MFRSLFSKAVRAVVPTPKTTLASLIDAESVIGGKLFGETRRGVERRFFKDEHHSWYYHESATDVSGQKLYTFTIRYEILPEGVLKSVDGKHHVFITGIELDHLRQAIKLYTTHIQAELYEQKPSTVSRAAHA